MSRDSEDAGWKIVSVNDWTVISTIEKSIPTGWRIVSVHGNRTPLYEGMHRMICKLAWQYARQTMLDAEDLINEGYLALLKVQDKYDPSRASRSTFVYWVVRNRFWYLAKRWPMGQELSEERLSENPSSLLESSHVFREVIHSLSDEAKDVVKLVLRCPQEICEMAKNGTSQCLQRAVTKILLKQGWIEERIVRAISEISTAINYNRKREE